MIGSILHDTEPNVAEKFILNSYADNMFNILDIEDLVKMLSQRSNLTKRQKLMSIARWLQADREDKDSMHTSMKWINNYSEFYNQDVQGKDFEEEDKGELFKFKGLSAVFFITLLKEGILYDFGPSDLPWDDRYLFAVLQTPPRGPA